MLDFKQDTYQLLPLSVVHGPTQSDDVKKEKQEIKTQQPAESVNLRTASEGAKQSLSHHF